MKRLLIMCALLIGINGFSASDTLEEAFNVVCGKYEVKISGKYKYTVRQIKYNGKITGTQSGYYGTVMTRAPGQYIGAGHTEGGIEKILKIEFFADGQPVTPETGKPLNTKNFLMRKISMFDKLCFKTELEITPDGITEQKQFKATALQPVNYIYIYLLCWNKSTTDWIADTASGKIVKGEFNGNFEQKSKWHLGDDVKWVANFDEKTGEGMMMYYPEVIKGKGRKSAFWEVKDAYNKYYLMMDSPNSFQAGYESPVYSMKLVGYSATKATLQAETEKLAAALSQDSLKPMQKLQAADLPEQKQEQADSGLAPVTFTVDYTESTDTVKAQEAAGDANGTLCLGSKAVFDFDTMAHTIRGLYVGENVVSVRYSTAGNLNPAEGAIEMVIKADDWQWNDNNIHIFLQLITMDQGVGKLYIYKYKTSGLAAYIELNGTGKKLFMNVPVANWKDKSWHHVVVTYSPEIINFYVDGKLCRSGELDKITEWGKYFYVGPASKSFGYKGGKSTISDIKFYSKPLSEATVRVLAKDQIPDLKLEVSAEEASKLDKREAGKPSPWFTQGKPRLGLKALDDDTVLPPWSPIGVTGEKINVWNRTYALDGNSILNSAVSGKDEILAAPINMQITTDAGTGTLTFGKTVIVKQNAGRVVLKRVSPAVCGIRAEIEYMIEFDGMMWCRLLLHPDGRKVTGLKMVIPYKTENAKFIHYVGAPTSYESQDLPKNSLSRALGSEQGILFKSGLKTNVWIGSNELGLLWFTESDRGWWPKERDNMIEVTRGADGNVALNLNLVAQDIPYDDRQELCYEFGLMATPVKPLPQGWRGMTFTAQYDAYKGDARGAGLIYWPNEWRFMSLDPDPHRALNVKYTQDKVKKDRSEGRKIIPYWTRLHFPYKTAEKSNPDAKYTVDWQPRPSRPGGGQFEMHRMACTSEWTDYLVWCVDEWDRIMGKIDGVYMDETQPIPNSNATSGGGYTDVTGKRRPTFEIFGSRNLIKRITYNIWQKNNELPWSIAHCSATHTMQNLSMYTAMLIGEQYYSGYFLKNPEYLPPENDRLYYYSYALPMDRLRAECYWKQWGAIMIWLPCLKNQKDLMSNPIPTRDMLSRVMQADMLVWPLFCNSSEVHKTWKFRKEFGIGEPGVNFIPYWENKAITANEKDVVVGYYQNGSKNLVLVSNLNRSAKTVEITFNGIGTNSVKNAETGKDIAVSNGKVKLDIPRNDYIALRVNY